ncbi:MAG: hypothetical protein KBI47_06920 [Armatimonadetes bacterium]|nr:hypothetical protein [Armatimonadota bacterium]
MTNRIFTYAVIVGIFALTLSIVAASAEVRDNEDARKPAVTAGHRVQAGPGFQGRMADQGQQGNRWQARDGQGQGQAYWHGQGQGQAYRHGQGQVARTGNRHQAGSGQGGRWNAPAEGRGMKTGPRDGTGRGDKSNCDGTCPNCAEK